MVVSADDGPMPQTREHIVLARQVGVRKMVVYINKVDQIDPDEREEFVELVTISVQELLVDNDFEEDTPIIVGSALKALEGDEGPDGAESVRALIQSLDDFIPEPERPIDAPFMMPIEDVFSISGRGTVVTRSSRSWNRQDG